MKQPEIARCNEDLGAPWNRHRNCFYQGRYRETSTFPRPRNDQVFRLRNRSRDIASSRDERKRECVTRSFMYEKQGCMFSPSERGKSPTSPLLSGIVSHLHLPGDEPYISADVEGLDRGTKLHCVSQVHRTRWHLLSRLWESPPDMI